MSTDPDAVNQPAPYRASFARVRDGSICYQMRELFGKPRVLDISEPLDRNGMPFLVVHVGVRSTFLRAAYEPWLRTALVFALLAVLVSVLAAALLATWRCGRWRRSASSWSVDAARGEAAGGRGTRSRRLQDAAATRWCG